MPGLQFHSTLADEHVWALVLAAGEGTRRHELTTTPSGIAVPKQFCSLAGGSSLLHEALSRAARMAAIERTCVVVASQHERWWQPPLRLLPRSNIVCQPRNRGTAIGILLPLLSIMQRDPEATLAVAFGSAASLYERDITSGLLRCARS
jgi:mannose-1-phosphate guanylyltransferase